MSLADRPEKYGGGGGYGARGSRGGGYGGDRGHGGGGGSGGYGGGECLCVCQSRPAAASEPGRQEAQTDLDALLLASRRLLLTAGYCCCVSACCIRALLTGWLPRLAAAGKACLVCAEDGQTGTATAQVVGDMAAMTGEEVEATGREAVDISRTTAAMGGQVVAMSKGPLHRAMEVLGTSRTPTVPSRAPMVASREGMASNRVASAASKGAMVSSLVALQLPPVAMTRALGAALRGPKRPGRATGPAPAAATPTSHSGASSSAPASCACGDCQWRWASSAVLLSAAVEHPGLGAYWASTLSAGMHGWSCSCCTVITDTAGAWLHQLPHTLVPVVQLWCSSPPCKQWESHRDHA